MNNMFTENVKQVMKLAREESARLGHNYIGTEHLLLGIIKDGKGKAVAVLTNLGLSLETVKQSVEDYVTTSGWHHDHRRGALYPPRQTDP